MSAPDWTAARGAYDALATRYDAVPVENRINGYMRRQSLARLLLTFPPGARVLEVGCGTGEEALALAEHGARVVAIDPSPEMIERARNKAAGRGLRDRARFVVAAAHDLGGVPDLAGPFDGAYASFSLAYEEDLAAVAAALHRALRPGAPFLASVPSRFCMTEFLLAAGTGHPGYAGRRLRPWHGHKVGEAEVPIRTYTPGSFAAAMAPHFRLEAVEALPAVVPPPYMNRVYVRLGGLADALERFDASVRTRAPFRSMGDHLVARLRRVP